MIRRNFFWKIRWAEAICLAGVMLYIAVFFALQVRLYEGLHMGMGDLGFYDQAMYIRHCTASSSK